MAKKKFKPLNLLIWLVGLLVTLAVAFGLIGKSLTIPYIPEIVTVVAGWVVVVTAIIGGITKLVS